MRALVFGTSAIRDAYEDTGLSLGAFAQNTPPATCTTAFGDSGLAPGLAHLHLVARAITRPKLVRRFDTRFFAGDADNITHRFSDVIGPATELVELVWLPIDEAIGGKLPPIVRQVLFDLKERIAAGMAPESPVPFYRFRGRRVGRSWL